MYGNAEVIRTRFISCLVPREGGDYSGLRIRPSKRYAFAARKAKMSDENARERLFQPNFQRNLIAGFLAVIPLVVVWLVFDFVLEALSNFGRPMANAFAQFIGERFPVMTPIFADGKVQWII